MIKEMVKKNEDSDPYKHLMPNLMTMAAPASYEPSVYTPAID